MSERKLHFKEVLIVSKLLEEVNFKYYVEYLLSNKIEKLLKSQGDRKEKMLVVICDVMAFILQNMYKAEESIVLLIMSYKQIGQEQVETMDIDELSDILKTIFVAGVPDIIKKIIDIESVKKKFQSGVEEMNLQNENN